MESISKSDVELWVQHKLTDSEWTKIRSEIEGRLDNFIDNLAEEIVRNYNNKVFKECFDCNNDTTTDGFTDAIDNTYFCQKCWKERAKMLDKPKQM